MISPHVDPTEFQTTGRYCTLTVDILSQICQSNHFSHIIDGGFVIIGDNIGYILHTAAVAYY